MPFRRAPNCATGPCRVGRPPIVPVPVRAGQKNHPVPIRRNALYNGQVKRSGIADLPLHGGRVPAWLAERMVSLGTAISETVLHHYGRGALLSRLSDPFW